jgi:hypothetical protein
MTMHPTVMTPAARSRGVAMIAALALLAVGSAVMVLMFMRTMDEIRHGRDDTAIVQTLLAAQGGTNLGKAAFQNDIKFALDTIASERSSTVSAWSFGSSGIDDDAPTVQSVADDLAAVAGELQTVIDDLLCAPVDLGAGVILTVRVYVTDTACGTVGLPPDTRLGTGRFVSGTRRELGGNQRYALPYVIVADGVLGDFQRRVITQGEARFVVGRRSFARYALFTDNHSFSGTTSRIWFTERTLFDGPVHTNGNFNFANTPWFGGAVSSAGVTGGAGGPGAYGYGTRFYTASELVEPFQSNPQNPNLGSDNDPVFAEAVPDWRADYIDLPSNAFDQRAIATLPSDHVNGSGLLFEDELEYMRLFASASDDCAPSASLAAGETATYQCIVVREQDSGTITRYRISQSGRLESGTVESSGDVTWTVETEFFNGVIYADEYIRRLEGPERSDPNDPDTAGPAIASFAQMTLVPEAGARITGDLTYETPPCVGSLGRNASGDIVRPACDNLDSANVLGIFSPTGDILIGHDNSNADLNAPRDVRIHGSLMTSQGVVTVEDYNQGSTRGAVELLGGIIERDYGPFGTFSGTTPQTGYGREFTYDPRFSRGLTPPYFPTVSLDAVTDVQVLAFGSREQIY